MYGFSVKRATEKRELFTAFLNGPLEETVTLQGTLEHTGNAPLGPGGANSRKEILEVLILQMLGKMVSKEPFEFGVESGTVVRVTEVSQFVEEDVVLQGNRNPHEIEVQVDVAL